MNGEEGKIILGDGWWTVDVSVIGA